MELALYRPETQALLLTSAGAIRRDTVIEIGTYRASTTERGAVPLGGRHGGGTCTRWIRFAAS